jgi:hypothetical protein
LREPVSRCPKCIRQNQARCLYIEFSEARCHIVYGGFVSDGIAFFYASNAAVKFAMSLKPW